jgi:photosystem I P700 chlorophyll a apoprotein A1
MDSRVTYSCTWNNISNALATASYIFGGDPVILGSKVALVPMNLGTADFMVHHIHAFTIHVTALILFKGLLYARNSRLIQINLT